ncbi:NAD(P)H-quinone oxidoreductase subunit 4, partial [Leptolyngbya sp. FACHB-711]|nr:NAD(P)H-quinone oxidoreductase subunit 4 [Leptolyngbya sp. FACHB-711]
VILTPIYLLSMLREIFFGPENKELVSHEALIDAEPREVFIIASLLIPIIGIGLYPKLITQVYDAKTLAVTATLQNSLATMAEQQTRSKPIALQPATAPAIE